MFRIVVALTAVMAGTAVAKEPVPAPKTESKASVADKRPSAAPPRKAEAGVDCGKLVDHLYDLNRAELSKSVPEGDRAGAVAELEKRFKAEAPQQVQECYDDPGVTKKSAQCLLSSKTMSDAMACMESPSDEAGNE